MSAPDKPAASVGVREFARLDGCDEGLVRRAIKRGKLPVLADGKLDPALAGSGWRRTNRRAGQGADTTADTREVSAQKVRTKKSAGVRTQSVPKTVADLAEALDQIDGDEAGTFLEDLLRGQFANTIVAEQIKENALAAKHLIAARKDAGDLVEVEIAEKVFFDAARSWRDVWAGFPSRIGPLLAADLGLETDPVVEALTIHVQDQLEQLGSPRGNFAVQEKSG